MQKLYNRGETPRSGSAFTWRLEDKKQGSGEQQGDMINIPLTAVTNIVNHVCPFLIKGTLSTHKILVICFHHYLFYSYKCTQNLGKIIPFTRFLLSETDIYIAAQLQNRCTSIHTLCHSIFQFCDANFTFWKCFFWVST